MGIFLLRSLPLGAHQMSCVDAGSRLEIIEHTSQVEEKIARNGEQKTVHVVVKNTPFTIQIGLVKPLGSTIDFNVVTLEAHLMYDCDGDRFVDFVRNKPIEYKGTMNESADKMTLEIRLKKLSSHLEDMFFKIRINGVDSFSKEPISYLSITTQPIKVVSKPEQDARIKEGQTGKAPAPKRTKKRSLNELMYETMQNIEKQQKEHQLLLQQISSGRPSTCAPAKSSKLAMEDSDLESALKQLIDAYQSTEPSQRPMKIRKLIRTAPTKDIDAVSELINHLQYSLQKDDQSSLHSHHQMFKQEPNVQPVSVDDIQRIDEFYRDFLFPSNSSHLSDTLF